MNTRFYNVKILTKGPEFEILEGEVWVEGNRIICVGKPKEEKVKFDCEIDGKGNLLMPGFKNAHTHSAMTFLRSYADDLPLLDWLNKQVFPMEAKLTPDDIYDLSKLAILEYLTSGITSNFDMYLTPDTIAQASVDMGFRTVMVGGVNNFSQSVQELEKWYEHYNHFHELIRFELGLHAEYTASEQLMKELAQLAETYHAPVYTHMSETEEETKGCMERHRLLIWTVWECSIMAAADITVSGSMKKI